MDRIRDIFRNTSRPRQGVIYTPLDNDHEHGDAGVEYDHDPPSMTSSAVLLSPRASKSFPDLQPISWFDYSVFLLLGVAMLWAWNCFLAAAAYFQGRFKDNKVILDTFQSSIMTVSTVTTLLITLALSRLQRTAHYPYRITCALIINIAVFTLLALSTVLFTNISAGVYLAFTLLMVLGTAVSSGFFQNGLFAYVSSFRPIYAQAVMAGQGVAGVLPAIAQMATVLVIPPKSPKESQEDGPAAASPKSAFAYFLTATAVSAAALFLFFILLARHLNQKQAGESSESASNGLPAGGVIEADVDVEPKKSVSMLTLLRKLPLPAFAVFFTFALTMVFPVFTQATLSVNPASASELFRPEVFIPFAFLVWNVGDLLGRVACGLPALVCTNPKVLAVGAVARVVFVPLYLLCNLKGRGAGVNSDLFYWVVQFFFGLTNGYVGSNSMMVAPSLVEEEEAAASGGFMGLCLVAGLAVGSAASFLLGV
ncbi:hypothetical protein DRE_03743 [Drechslerella stenobrocha 248]|uniref:Nucleoside transporter FUN26 n=1 Tax=Drechslerella stenobrocha 248 TaxID=1043628 RepID=W7HSJ1_9PEZI|nr:hypothetical protein DRE_03743 [Drechslerella stenobrocha 248]